jgi:hypothetical protein
MGRLFWGLVLVVVGGLFLAANLGWIDVGFVISLWRLWPLILVVVGVNLLLGGRHRALAAVLTVAIVAGGLGVAYAGWHSGDWAVFGGGNVTTTPITQPASPGVTAGSATIDVAASEVVVHGPGPGSAGRLVDGSFQTARKPVIGQTVSNGTYALNVGAEGSDVVVLPWNAGGSRRERLELGVSSTIPWVITLNGGATKTQIDLTDVLLRELVLGASASSVRVIVGPQVTDGARVTINGSVGSYHVTLPKDLHILLTLDTSLASRNLEGFTSTGGNRFVHDGPGKAMDVSIKTSVGAIRVDLR